MRVFERKLIVIIFFLKEVMLVEQLKKEGQGSGSQKPTGHEVGSRVLNEEDLEFLADIAWGDGAAESCLDRDIRQVIIPGYSSPKKGRS
jgi:hypothetical protein